MEDRLSQLLQRVQSLNDRADHIIQNTLTQNEQRVYQSCIDSGLSKFKIVRAPSNYYDLTLDQRRDLLNAESVDDLCMSLMVYNTKGDCVDCSDRDNSLYYCLIKRYTSKFMSHKLFKFIRGLKDPKLPRGKYKFRFVSEKESISLSGYEHNAVTPFGMIRNDIPIVLAEEVTQSNGYFWLGAGEVNTKLGVDIKEFIEKCNPLIGDITE